MLESDTTMKATNLVPIDDVAAANAVLRVSDVLDDHEDVQDVHSNIDLDDAIIAHAGPFVVFGVF